MKMYRYFVAMIFCLCGVAMLAALPAQYAPPLANKPSDETLTKINQLKDKLDRALRMLRRNGIHDPLLSDVEVYHKAATWITRHNEFYHKDASDWTVEVLECGLIRASQVSQAET